jgi:hypothetical protein
MKHWAIAFILVLILLSFGAVCFANGSQSNLSSQPESMVHITAEAEGLSQIDPTSLPKGSGASWLVTTNGFATTDYTFTGLQVTNDYGNSSSVTVQVDVTGSPYYIAVLVDSEDFSNASWSVYSGSSVSLNLGSTEGWHDVWIGVRGHADDISAATWHWKRLKLDLTPPAIVVTGPTKSTVDVPMIQLTGYCPEDLASISYDLTNDAISLTNQQIVVLDRHFDRSAFEFTTNTFQGFDIALTNGVNTFTIHATDQAGNSVTTNLSFTLDLSAKTNPPVLQINWPQNGTRICSSSFTLDGQLSDPTATVTASIADASGKTNIFKGLVGRSGKFWVENIPLRAGTNALTLRATDVVGNTTVTNIILLQDTLALTVNPVENPDQLWQPTVNLTGTVSDKTYTVWVNGVKGRNNGDGTWSASNVPVPQGGTAEFTVTAYAPDEMQPDGSYGN